jgi:hypothetical protein
MELQEGLMVAVLKGTCDIYVTLGKALVRAAFLPDGRELTSYARGYRDATRRERVKHLLTVRSLQRVMHEFCKGVGYYVR